MRSMSNYGDFDAADGSLEVVDRNELPDMADEDEDFEGLENVRVCCGEHDGA